VFSSTDRLYNDKGDNLSPTPVSILPPEYDEKSPRPSFEYVQIRALLRHLQYSCSPSTPRPRIGTPLEHTKCTRLSCNFGPRKQLWQLCTSAITSELLAMVQAFKIAI
jgi:hypothetical protein